MKTRVSPKYALNGCSLYLAFYYVSDFTFIFFVLGYFNFTFIF